jgi:ribosomal protein S18 acetylase RimI-like enzyme
MNSLITLAALTGPPEHEAGLVPPRRIEARDLPELTLMYQHAYADGPAHASGGNVDRVGALFDGVHGRPVPEASLVTAGPDGRLTAAIIITDCTPGNEGGAEAFIAELFTHPDHRRQGLAEELLRHSMDALHSSGRTTVAVSVDSSNSAAMALYLSRDFRRIAVDDSNND